MEYTDLMVNYDFDDSEDYRIGYPLFEGLISSNKPGNQQYGINGTYS